MSYTVFDDAGHPLDAHFDLEGTTVFFHSRGGVKGKNARNLNYDVALRLVLSRVVASKLAIAHIAVDTAATVGIPFSQRTVFAAADPESSAEQVYMLITSRMKTVGQDPLAKGGNATKRLAIKLAGARTEQDVLEVLQGRPQRLPAAELAKVTAEHLMIAVENILAGVSHPFAASTDYDVVLNSGERLPPKAVFGVAASLALGFTVFPAHFVGGLGSPCFRALAAAGYKVLEKDASLHGVPAEAEDMEWSEGTPKLRAHLKKERRSGVGAAKRTEFKRLHGKLFCELCKLDPVEAYGDESGEASIEVHHAEIQVKDMAPGHSTKLPHLQCLCANCHRVLHRRMKLAESSLTAGEANEAKTH